MTRIQLFNQLKDHPLIGRQFKKLTNEEYEFCLKFLKENDELSDGAFVTKTNRLGLAGELANFKNKTLIWALLSQSIIPKFPSRRY